MLHPQLLVEQKEAAVALHYRQAPELESLCLDTLTEAVSRSPGTELMRGKLVFEVKPQGINKGRPEGRIVLNKMRTRDSISKELKATAPQLGVKVAKTVIRDLQAYRDAAGQGSCVTRLGKKTQNAADEIDALCQELLGTFLTELASNGNGKEVANG